MEQHYDLDRALLAGVLTAADELPPLVVVEVALAYDILCDPTDPPVPPMPVLVTDPASSIRWVVDRLMAAISAETVQQTFTLGYALRHLRAALHGLDEPASPGEPLRRGPGRSCPLRRAPRPWRRRAGRRAGRPSGGSPGP